MRFKEIPHDLVLAKNEPGYIRSPGLHMSDCYGSYFKELDPKRYAKKTAKGEDAPFDLTVMEEGMAFEGWLEPQLRQRLLGDRPGEFFTQHEDKCKRFGEAVKDGSGLCWCGAGIAYSPDWLFLEDDGMVLGEFKRSKYSLRDAPADKRFSKWICQMQSYCYHLPTQVARLYVLFVNGDYSYKPPGGDEQIKAWEFSFTKQELRDNWKQLRDHARKKGLLGVTT